MYLYEIFAMQLSHIRHRSNNKSIDECREDVIVHLTRGLKGYQIAKELNLTPSTLSNDNHYLPKESSINLKSIVKEILPFL